MDKTNNLHNTTIKWGWTFNNQARAMTSMSSSSSSFVLSWHCFITPLLVLVSIVDEMVTRTSSCIFLSNLENLLFHYLICILLFQCLPRLTWIASSMLTCPVHPMDRKPASASWRPCVFGFVASVVSPLVLLLLMSNFLTHLILLLYPFCLLCPNRMVLQ